MPGGDERLLGRFSQKPEAQRHSFLFRPRGQAKFLQSVQAAPLGELQLVPAFQITGNPEVRDQDVHAAGRAKSIVLVRRNEPIANLMLPPVLTSTEMISADLDLQQSPSLELMRLKRLHCSAFHHVAEREAATDATVILKKDFMAAVIALKSFHLRFRRSANFSRYMANAGCLLSAGGRPGTFPAI
jgi:hypothetical protein